jgi:hypothetical protein
MASRTSTVKGLEIVRAGDDAGAGDTLGQVFRGILYVANETGSAVTAATDTLDTVLATAIAAQRKNGKTVVARGFCLANPARTRSSAGVYATVGGTVSGTTTCAIAPVAVSDWSTGATIAGTDAFEEPYGIFVMWTEA